MKKPLRRAILDGAAQIAVPAFVSTLAICIVFVPVVFLTGPAAYLFTPLALAVVFAMLASYFLSRTLVPTMVLYLLPKEAEAEAEAESRGTGAAHGSPLWSVIRHPSRFHHAFNRGFERLRLAYHGLLGWALDHRFVTVDRDARLRPGLAGVVSLDRPGLLPERGRGAVPAARPAPAGTRIEETERIFGQVEDVIREVVPDSERAMILDNIGLTQSFTIMAFLNTGTVSDADGEILVSLKPDHRPTADYVARLRDELPRRFPDCTFYFEPADITSQILNFGLPAPIDVQVVGVKREANLAVAQKLSQEIAKIPGIADVHLQQITDLPDLRLNVDRIMASELGLTQQDVAGSVLVSLSSTNQVSPNFWVNPAEPGQLPRGRADPGAPHPLGRHADEHAHHQRASRVRPSPAQAAKATGTPDQPTQLLGNLADLSRGTQAANINHYNVQPVYDVYANVQGRDLGAVSADVQKIVDAARRTCRAAARS